MSMVVSSLHDVPGVHVFQASVRGHEAATDTEIAGLLTLPFDARVRAVHIRPDAAIAGTDSDSTNINLLNLGVDGDGSTELANIDFENDTDADAGALVTLYAPATPLAVNAGTLLALEIEKLGDGLELPSFLAIVEYEGA